MDDLQGGEEAEVGESLVLGLDEEVARDLPHVLQNIQVLGLQGLAVEVRVSIKRWLQNLQVALNACACFKIA